MSTSEMGVGAGTNISAPAGLVTEGIPPQPTDIDQSSLSYPPLDVQSTERIAQMARLHLRDLPIAFLARVLCNGVSWRFDLPVENIDQSQFQVVLTDGTPQNTTGLTVGTDLSVDFRSGVLILNTPPAPGLMLVSQGVYYKDFLPGELDLYVRIAYIQHTQGVDPTPQLDAWPPVQPPVSGYGTPPPIRLPEIEEFPMSLLVAQYALDDLATMVAQQGDIHTPDGIIVPRGQIFQQLRVRIQDIEARYIKLCSLLGIGLYRITMGTLRRVSRTNNRLIPVYIAREYDDMRLPQRHLPASVDKFERIITDEGLYVSTMTYSKDQVVFENGRRYIALQDVPAGKDPVVDVDPASGSGFFWAWTTIGMNNWGGFW